MRTIKKKYSSLKAIRNDKIKVIKNGEECRVNCYGIAYTTLDVEDL